MIYSILASFPALLNICLCPDYTQHSYLSKVHSTFLSVQNTPNSLLCPGYIQHSYTPRLYSTFLCLQTCFSILPCPGYSHHSSRLHSTLFVQSILNILLSRTYPAFFYPEYTQKSSLSRIYSFFSA